MTDAPERIWATGNGKTGSWNDTDGKMKFHMPDNWQTEYIRADVAGSKITKLEARIRIAEDQLRVAFGKLRRISIKEAGQ